MLISVVIPTLNRSQLVLEAVKSVLNQTVKPFEIIVVDDGSTDDTKEVLEDLNIKYIYQENKGVSSARNRGIQEARGGWIAFLDSDDVWLENKLEEQILFHQNNDFLISQTDESWVRDGQKVNKTKKYKKQSGAIFFHSLDVCSITPSSVIINKVIFEDIGLFDESLEVCEDYDLWLRITRLYPVGLIEKELIEKRAGHGDQLSFKYHSMDLYRLKALKKHSELPDVKDLIDKKRNILYKGAKKYNNDDLIKEL
ncbi:MAG: glycosyltransferase family 2 protein, partial [Campylobacterales bacterium]|nr:glycosyltransferase family 2 protein [Campylobacterales bacterium]